MSDQDDALATIRSNPVASALYSGIELVYAERDTGRARIAALEAALADERAISERMRKRAEVAEREVERCCAALEKIRGMMDSAVLHFGAGNA